MAFSTMPSNSLHQWLLRASLCSGAICCCFAQRICAVTVHSWPSHISLHLTEHQFGAIVTAATSIATHRVSQYARQRSWGILCIAESSSSPSDPSIETATTVMHVTNHACQKMICYASHGEDRQVNCSLESEQREWKVSSYATLKHFCSSRQYEKVNTVHVLARGPRHGAASGRG